MVVTGDIGKQWWKERFFRSVTLYPWATMDTEAVVNNLIDQDINSVFVIVKESDGRVFYDSDVAPPQVPDRDLLGELVDTAADHDLTVVPSLFVLCDKYLIEQHPEVVQVAREGSEIRYPNVSAEWMHWVCPNHNLVRDHLGDIVDELLEYDIDGLQFSHFEFQPVMNDESSYRSCFCEACLSRHDALNIDDNSGEWIDVRCNSVTGLLKELSAPLHDRDDLMVNVEMETFANLESAVEDSRDTLGVDPPSIAEFADVLTPRTPHIDVDMHPLWIRDIIRSLEERTGCPIVPSIRTADSKRPQTAIPSDELMTAIQMALHGGSQGVSLFSTGANLGRISDDQWDTVRDQYQEIKQFEREYWRPN